MTVIRVMRVERVGDEHCIIREKIFLGNFIEQFAGDCEMAGARVEGEEFGGEEIGGDD